MVESREPSDDRWRTREDLAELSERDLTRLAFRRAVKNVAFFVPLAILAGLVVGLIGTACKIVGWIAIAFFALPTLEPLAAFAAGVVALLGALTVRRRSFRADIPWRLTQVFLSLATSLAYALSMLWIYSRMRR
jgi:hypothetical protein